MSPKKIRQELKKHLEDLTDDNRLVFKRMYSHLDLDKDINLVVDKMPSKQLQWALTQVLNTKYRLFHILKDNHE